MLVLLFMLTHVERFYSSREMRDFDSLYSYVGNSCNILEKWHKMNELQSLHASPFVFINALSII